MISLLPEPASPANGRWHCLFCKVDVTLPTPSGRWDFKHGQPCPVCGNNSCDWLTTKQGEQPNLL